MDKHTAFEILREIFAPRRPEGFNVPSGRFGAPNTPMPEMEYREDRDDYGQFSVNFLAPECKPANCEILCVGDSKSYRRQKDYQTHYLVRHTSGSLLRFRVCKAGKDSGYDAYACGNFISEDQIQRELESVEFFGNRA